MDLYTLCAYVGIKQPNVIVKHTLGKFGFHPCMEQFINEDANQESTGPKRMNLLILGAGSQGPVVKETTEALGVFHEIAFWDDDSSNPLAIDCCMNYLKYVDRYPITLPSFGNCQLRANWIEKLEAAGFILPVLVHPMAAVSPSAVIGEGTIVEVKAIVGTNARIAHGYIISSGAVIDVNAKVGETPMWAARPQ